MGIELGRISGPLLAANLLRNGVDLAFETDLIYIDVANGRIGIRTDGPDKELDVNGTISTTNLIVDTQADIAKLSLFSNRVQNLVDEINFVPNQLLDPTVVTRTIETDSLRLTDNYISNFTLDDDITFNTVGAGQVVFNTSKVVVDGNLHATGNISFSGGTITIGSDDNDNVIFESDIGSNLVPDVNDTYDLGQLDKQWRTLYAVNASLDTITSPSLVINDIDLLQTQGNTIYVSINGSDTNTGTHQHATFRTIKHALSVATSTDTIIVYPGDYLEEFPLTVPQGVTVAGAGIRAVSVAPTLATNTNDAFLLNGETTVENLTVKDFYYDAINDTGYGFKFANNILTTSRSPYVRNCTVITKQSVITAYTENRSLAAGDWPSAGWFYREPSQNHLVLATNMVDPEFATAITSTTIGTIFSVTYVDDTVDILTQTNDWDWFGFTANLPVTGFNGSSIKTIKAISWGLVSTPQGDAGNGALVDGAVVNSAALEPAMLFHAVTMIIPGAEGIIATNGARVEWLNSFTYYANRGVHLTEGTLGFASLGVKFGAEMRSINSANVYGNYGAVADGPSTLAYLIGHNFGYIGTGTNSFNDRGLVIQGNEVVELNSGTIYYDSMDHKGDYRIGDIFYVNQETGNITFNAQSIDLGSAGNITLEGPDSFTIIDKYKVQTGNIQFAGNTISSLVGPVNWLAANNTISLSTDVFVTGTFEVVGNTTFDGDISLGNSAADLININSYLTQDFVPKNTTLNLGVKGLDPKVWNTVFLSALDTDGVTSFDSNTITTLTTDTDLVLDAAGDGEIHVTTTDVKIDQSLTVVGTTTINGLSTLQNTETVGTTTLIGAYNQTGSLLVEGTFTNNGNIDVLSTSYLELPTITINSNAISITDVDTDLVFSANGLGGVVLDQRLKIVDSTISNVWASATTDSQKSIYFTPNGTGNVVIDSTKSLKVPYTNNTNEVLSTLGQIRQNSTTTWYEGYHPTGNVSFNNLYDLDKNTYIIAEPTPGINDDILRFGVNGVERATISSTSLATPLVYADNVSISSDTFSNVNTTLDLEVGPDTSTTTDINGILIQENTITNQLDTALTLASTGVNGWVKFGGKAVVFPYGPTSDRRLTPELGETRYNSTLNYMEVWNGTAWIPAVGTLSAIPLSQVLDIMDEWALILG